MLMEAHKTHQTTICSIQSGQVFTQGQNKCQKYGVDDNIFDDNVTEVDVFCPKRDVKTAEDDLVCSDTF
eukprot:12257058-Ditylum_brightwellii.AAC.1